MVKDFSGNVYGNIEVLEKTNRRKRDYVVYICKCNSCGKVFENSLETYRKRAKKGITTMTCGCYDRHHNNFYKNGLSNTRLRHIYDHMKSRCYNSNNPAYKNYGYRGITICKEWLDVNNGFETFYNWAIANGYKEDLTIDRINVNGNYEPDNCRWIEFGKQMNNRRNTIKIEYNGKVYPLTDLARQYKIPIVTLRCRLSRGWSIERALNEKVHKNFKGKHSEKYYKHNNIQR